MRRVRAGGVLIASRPLRPALWLALLAPAAGCSFAYPFDYSLGPGDAAPDAPRDASDVGPPLDAPPDDASLPACPAGFLRCGSEACNDVQSNVSRCGGCSNVCALAGATPACDMGRCVVASCNAGLGDCDGDAANGCETRLSTSPSHCGRCGLACAPPNATAACVDSVCRILACATGFSDCDGNAANGCEVDTRARIDHCGACGRACSEAGGSALCTNGACVLRCDSNHADCNGDAADGCEVSTATSITNCGRCGIACGAIGGAAACVGGACRVMCTATFVDCNGNVGDGCEVDTSSDPANCGACGMRCLASASCAGGACVTACPAGQTACTGRCVTLATDPRACGGCDRVCSAPANASPTCAASTCSFACRVGWGNCDGDAVNGCETNLRDTVASCGACGRACALANATARCNGGGCEVASCNAGFGDCDGVAANGCEANLASEAHCGRCGNACAAANGSGACAAGACALTCRPGFRDCDGAYANGCEANVSTDVAHCGRCGNACNLPNVLTHACMGGACGVVACRPGYGDCDGVAANGCETNTLSAPAHCGACGRPCAGTCAAGVCAVSMTCGAADQPCCPGSICSDGACVQGACETSCGAPDGRCCPGATCGPRAYCSSLSLSGMCVACGAPGQPCCRERGAECVAGAVCESSMTCVASL